MAEELGSRPELKRNPLLLTARCVKYKEGKRLPHDIYHLYDSVVNQVLYNRFRSSDRERTQVRWRLEAVALGMHYGIDDQSVRSAPLASVDLEELGRILGRYAKQNPSTEGQMRLDLPLWILRMIVACCSAGPGSTIQFSCVPTASGSTLTTVPASLDFVWFAAPHLLLSTDH